MRLVLDRALFAPQSDQEARDLLRLLIAAMDEIAPPAVQTDPPYVLGVEGVGIVESAGDGFLAKRLVGRRVAISADGEGTYRDVTIVDAKRALPVPRTLSDEAASMIFVNPLTAYAIVHEVLRVRREDTVLITAAGSALGRMVIRLGKSYGFETIAVVRRPELGDELRRDGATHVIAADPMRLVEAVRDATRGAGANHALDCVGGALGTAVIRSLTVDGHAVLYGTLSREPIELAPRDLMMPVARVSGFFLPTWLARQSLFTKLRVLRAVTSAIGDGTLATEVAATFSLDRHREAFEAAMRPGTRGKVLFRMR